MKNKELFFLYMLTTANNISRSKMNQMKSQKMGTLAIIKDHN